MAVSNILDQSPQLELIVQDRWWGAGPSNEVVYSLLQGAMLVLVIESTIIFVRSLTKGTADKRFSVARIGYHLVMESFKDPYKFISMVARRPITGERGNFEQRRKPARWGRRGWLIVLGAFLIHMALFLFDLVLVFLSLPARTNVGADRVSHFSWGTRTNLTAITKENLLRGSFSKSIFIHTRGDNAEFLFPPTISIERTDFERTPLVEGLLLNCSANEQWRFVCKVRTETLYYQLKVRVDVRARGDESEYFAPTTDFDFGRFGKDGFPSAILNQLKEILPDAKLSLAVSSTPSGNNTFLIKNEEPVQDRIMLGGESVRVHDLVSSYVLAAIDLTVDDFFGGTYFQRKPRERDVNLSGIDGVLARTQRPRFSLILSLLVFALLALASFFLQRFIGRSADDFESIMAMEYGNVGCTTDIVSLAMNDTVIPFARHENADEGTGHSGYFDPAELKRRRRHDLHERGRAEMDLEPRQFQILQQELAVMKEDNEGYEVVKEFHEDTVVGGLRDLDRLPEV